MVLHLLASVFILAVILFLTIVINFGRQNYGKLENCGFPVMKPYFLFGSRPHLHKQNAFQEDVNLFKKYGPIWGLYRGQLPEVYVADPELIRLIFVRDTQTHFQNRDTFTNITHPLIKNMIAIVSGEKWRIMKSALSPATTAAKLKGMSGAVADSARETITQINNKLGLESSAIFDMQKLFKSLTSDVMARTVFGIQVSDIRDPNNEFMKNLNYVTGEDNSDPTFKHVLKFTFPTLFPANSAPSPLLDYFQRFLSDLLDKRMSDPQAYNDVLDILKDLALKLESPEFKSAGIEKVTILAQAMIFVFAGHLVNSTALTLISYALAKNPEKQKLLHSEIDEFWDNRHNGGIDASNEFNHIFTKLPYLDACITETLRKYHVTERPRRECNKDWSHNGIRIPKGAHVIIPILAVHYNPDFYTNPHEFRPERFLSPEKDNQRAYTLHSFGHGARSCLGTRFFLAQAKVALVHILHKYTFNTSEETKLSFRPGRTSTVSLKHKLFLSIGRR